MTSNHFIYNGLYSQNILNRCQVYIYLHYKYLTLKSLLFFFVLKFCEYGPRAFRMWPNNDFKLGQVRRVFTVALCPVHNPHWFFMKYHMTTVKALYFGPLPLVFIGIIKTSWWSCAMIFLRSHDTSHAPNLLSLGWKSYTTCVNTFLLCFIPCLPWLVSNC